MMAKKSYKSLEAEYKKLLNEKNAKSITQVEKPIVAQADEKLGKYTNVVETPKSKKHWRGMSLAVGVGDQGTVRFHTNMCSNGACVVARSMTELDEVLDSIRETAQKLTDNFVPIPKKE